MSITLFHSPYPSLPFPPLQHFRQAVKVDLFSFNNPSTRVRPATFATDADTDTTIAMKYTTNTVTFYLQQHFILQLFARVFVQSIYSPFTDQQSRRRLAGTGMSLWP